MVLVTSEGHQKEEFLFQLYISFTNPVLNRDIKLHRSIN